MRLIAVKVIKNIQGSIKAARTYEFLSTIVQICKILTLRMFFVVVDTR